MGNVTLIQKGHEPDRELIALLEALLADAKAGRLAALAGVADYHDGESDYLHAGTMDFWAMSGLLADLSREIVLDDDDE